MPCRLFSGEGGIARNRRGSSAPARGQLPFGDGFDNLLMHFVDGEVAFDAHDALRLTGGDFAVFLPNTAMECVLLKLKAAGWLRTPFFSARPLGWDLAEPPTRREVLTTSRG